MSSLTAFPVLLSYDPNLLFNYFPVYSERTYLLTNKLVVDLWEDTGAQKHLSNLAVGLRQSGQTNNIHGLASDEQAG